MEEGDRVRRPTSEEVIAKLKDDGDFDSLRLKIIRKVKENEELRNTIITEVKQSEILNQDDSENLKPRQISDAIYQELGKKIMGQISDEVWKVIRNDSTKTDIRGTVESVYDRMLNPKPKEEECHHTSPAKVSTGKQIGAPMAPAPAEEASTCDEREPKMPPGFAPPESHYEQLPNLPSEEELHSVTNMVDEDMPPGFGFPGRSSVAPSMNTDDGGADAPPGFETGGAGFSAGAAPPGFGVCDDDDLDAPPGFGW